MIARAWGWLRGAGSWIVAVAVALPVLGWIWTAWQAEIQARRGAEAQAESERRRAEQYRGLLDTLAKTARDRAATARELRAEVQRIHDAYTADRARLEAMRERLESAQSVDEVTAAWREQFGGGE